MEQHPTPGMPDDKGKENESSFKKWLDYFRCREKNSAGFKQNVAAVLKKKGYAGKCYALETFIETVETNTRLATRKIQVSKYPGFVLLIAIPLISALLSAIVGLDKSLLTWLPETGTVIISLLLTILTILNSILKPSQRFKAACEIATDINSFKTTFLIELECAASLDESRLLELVSIKEVEFKEFQKKLIYLFMPYESDAQQAR